MNHFSKNIYKLLEKNGIKKCAKKEPVFLKAEIPSFIEELLLHFEWPDKRFFLKQTRGFWFTNDEDESSMPYEFSGEYSQMQGGYYSLASDQNLEICLNPNETDTMDPTLYLIDMEEMMVQQYRKENPNSVLAKHFYEYEFETFKLSWMLKKIKYFDE